MKKTPQASTKKVKAKSLRPIAPSESKQPWWDIECRHSYQKKSINLAWVERLAERLDKWLEDEPDALYIAQFYRKEGLTKDSYDNLVNGHDFLKRTHSETMRELGDRMWAKCVMNKANLAAVRLRLPRYAPENLKDEEILAKVKEEGEGTGVINIVLPPTPDSKEVKPKVKK